MTSAACHAACPGSAYAVTAAPVSAICSDPTPRRPPVASPQDGGLQLETDQEEQRYDAKLGEPPEVLDVVRDGRARGMRADDHAGDEKSDHRAEAEPLREGDRHRGDEQQEDGRDDGAPGCHGVPILRHGAPGDKDASAPPLSKAEDGSYSCVLNDQREEPPRRWPRQRAPPDIATVVLLVLAVSVLHYATVTSIPLLHDVYRRLYYLPRGVGRRLVGVRGGSASPRRWWRRSTPRTSCSTGSTSAVKSRTSSWRSSSLPRSPRSSASAGRELPLPPAQRGDRGEAGELLPGVAAAGETSRSRGSCAVPTVSRPGELAATVTHEIRNPLSSIRGTVEILEEDFPANSPKAEFFEILLKETDRLNKVVEEYLGLARSKAAGGTTALLDLGDLARQEQPRWSVSRRRSGGCG